MAVELKRIDPSEMRERIFEFYWNLRLWPQYPTREGYFRFWDWRTRVLSEDKPAIWVAREGPAVVGTIAVYFRNLSLNGRRVRAGTSADFLLDAAYPAGARLGAALCSAPRTLVRSGEIDLLTGYGIQTAHRLLLASGSHDLGPMRLFLKVRRWAPLLRRRAAALAPLAPAADAAVGAWNLLRGSRNPELLPHLKARPVTPEQVAGMSRAHWRLREALCWDGSLDYLAKRFCASEFKPRRMMAVTDSRNGRLEGVVATEGSNRLFILQCAVNESVISPAQAIESVVAADPEIESVRVPLLPDSDLAREFVAAGYLPLSAKRYEPVFRDTFWSAFWLPEHPLAQELAQTHHWNLWYGWSHH